MAFNQAYNLQPWQYNAPGNIGNLTVVDKVPLEMLSLVDAHWHQFPPSKLNISFKCLKLIFFYSFSESFVALDSGLRNRCLRSYCYTRQLMRYVYLYKDQIAPYSIKSFGSQLGCL